MGEESEVRNPQSEIDPYERERRLYRAVKAMAETSEGKEVLAWLCEMVEFGGTAFRADSHQTDFALGMQDPVNRLMHIVHTPMETLLERVEREEAVRLGRTSEMYGGQRAAGWSLFGK